MNLRSPIVWLSAVLVGILVIFLFNLLPLFQTATVKPYISLNEVEGVEIIHNGTPYTFNFQQQTELVGHLNRLIPVKNIRPNPENLNFNRLVIYRFSTKPLIISPVAYNGNNLVFSIPEWRNDTFLSDVSGGSLKSLLESTYDP